jgi:hypothetical protein
MIVLLSMFLIVLGVQSAAAEHTQSCEDRSYSVSNHFSLVCSATWQFDGVCDGTSDMWDRWKLSGRTVQPNDPFIRPWLDQDITVIGYELVKVKGSSDSWFMVGSAMQADAQMWLAPHETR